MDNNFIILLIGRSGSGKDTTAKFLQDSYGWQKVKSYTTRPLRENDPTDLENHIFITDEEFDKLNQSDIIAYTEFNGYRYCATTELVENSQVYIIDYAGAEYFKTHYDGNKHIYTIYLDASWKTLWDRMIARGDSEVEVIKRIAHDDNAFKFIKWLEDYDYKIDVDYRSANEVAELIHMWVTEHEDENWN